jgi:nicotinamide riboside kinase
MALIVNFIGAPCSGKTTTAAKLFANLKTMGISCEFVSEFARKYLATRSRGSSLSDAEQELIMVSQFSEEGIFENQDVITVSDSSPLNALLYMSSHSEETKALAKKCANDRDAIFFYCHPVPFPTTEDPNRVHSIDASRSIHSGIPNTLGEVFSSGFEGSVIPLYHPSAETRAGEATQHVLERFMTKCLS